MNSYQRPAPLLCCELERDVQVVREEAYGSTAGTLEVEDRNSDRAYRPGCARHISFLSDSIPLFRLQATALQIHFPHP